MRKQDIKTGLIFGFFLILIAVLTNCFLKGFYTFEWANRHVFAAAALIIFIPACLGKTRFSSAALAGYVLGLICGELFGGFRASTPPQYLHYGWLILIGTFGLFCLVGIAMQKCVKPSNKQG